MISSSSRKIPSRPQVVRGIVVGSIMSMLLWAPIAVAIYHFA